MTGSLLEKKGKFYMILRFKEGGKWKQTQRATGLNIKNNKTKAEKMLKEYLVKNNDDDLKKSNQIMFTDYLKQWLKSKANLTEKVTIDGYEFLLEKHILPYFQTLKLKLKDVKPIHISEFYNYKMNGGRIDGKQGGYSWETISKFKMILNNAFKQATSEELILRNPAENIKLPIRKEKVREAKFLEAGQANELLHLFEGHRLYSLIATTLYYGLRRSEVLGLKWDAVDFENDVLEIKHTVVISTVIERKDHTKTKSSRGKSYFFKVLEKAC